MNVRTALISILPFGLLGVVACSATTSSSQPATPTSVEVAAASTTPTTPDTVADLVSEPSTTVTLPPAETLPPLPPPPEPTLPPTPPSFTIPPVILPLPPVCLEPSVEDEPVEFVATDWGVTYHGDTVPACMRIPESFALRFVNNAEGDLDVAMGASGGVVFAGDTVTTAPLGDIFFVGDEFELVFTQLGVSVTVEVVAA